jgi:hypothetical protein
MAVIVLLFLFMSYGSCGKLLFGLAVLADALVQDICDLDGHWLGVFIPVRCQARGVSHGAIHVFHPAAADAHSVVVIVANPGLIKRRGVRGFEAAQHLQVREIAKHYINGLRRQFRKLFAGSSKDAFCRGVRVVLDGGEDCQTLFGHTPAVGMQGCGPFCLLGCVIGHVISKTLIMRSSQ